MTEPLVGPGAVESTPHALVRPRARTIVRVVFVVAVFLAAAWTIWTQRARLAESLAQLGAWPIVTSCVLATAGTALTYLQWREVLGGLGVRMRLDEGARVFFLSQLGKYLPGSIWPVVMQMEAGRERGASRSTMVAANLFTIVLGCTVGLMVACVLLPFAAPGTIAHYWWALLALPVLLVLLHPATMPALLNIALRVLRRAPITERLSMSSTLRAGMWALLSFVLLGSHVAVLVGALAGWTVESLAISIGAVSLAVCVGVLAIPVPAGIGVRDGVLVLALSPTVGLAPAVLLAVTSRLLISLSDLLLATMVLGVRPIASDKYQLG
ncbi:lysylphosphatidylglycerol synthase domain-containing protein [Nocardioides sp. NPDC101246]|uniref:lysylphosphatidylglycerol synthase domain-containing protein n=1 Tax=Nocardioides sp. NPDC101246 TaxID=3364336 RepID=UPI00382C2C9B